LSDEDETIKSTSGSQTRLRSTTSKSKPPASQATHHRCSRSLKATTRSPTQVEAGLIPKSSTPTFVKSSDEDATDKSG